MCACSVNAWHKWCQAALMRELQRLEIVKASAAAGKALSWAAICSCEKKPEGSALLFARNPGLSKDPSKHGFMACVPPSQPVYANGRLWTHDTGLRV